MHNCVVLSCYIYFQILSSEAFPAIVNHNLFASCSHFKFANAPRKHYTVYYIIRCYLHDTDQGINLQPHHIHTQIWASIVAIQETPCLGFQTKADDGACKSTCPVRARLHGYRPTDTRCWLDTDSLYTLSHLNYKPTAAERNGACIQPWHMLSTSSPTHLKCVQTNRQ